MAKEIGFISRDVLSKINDGTFHRVDKGTYINVMDLVAKMNLIRGNYKEKDEYRFDEKYIKYSFEIRYIIDRCNSSNYEVIYIDKSHDSRISRKYNGNDANFIYHIEHEDNSLILNEKILSITNISKEFKEDFSVNKYNLGVFSPIINIFNYIKPFYMKLILNGNTIFPSDDFNNIIFNNIIKKLSLPYDNENILWDHSIEIELYFSYDVDNSGYKVYLCNYNYLY